MRKLQLGVSALLLVIAIGLAPLFVGCEDEPGTADVESLFAENDTENEVREDGTVPLSLDPLQGSISVIGQRIAFRALGAVLPVTWSPADRTAGTLTVVGSTSEYAVFQALAVLPNTVLAVDALGRTTTATIGIGGLNALQISPNSATIADIPGITVQFTAAGGSQPYVSWTAAFSIMGDVNSTGLYTPKLGSIYQQGTNLITVIDSAGEVATAQVIHQ